MSESRASLIQNEKPKLAAGLFNNIAVAFVAAGVIVPAVAAAYETGTPQGRFWVVMAGANHLIGRTILSGIKP